MERKNYTVAIDLGSSSVVVAVGEKASVAAISRVESDGLLTLLGETPIGSGANWVRIIG